MNLKQAKRIRSDLRTQGLDLRERHYGVFTDKFRPWIKIIINHPTSPRGIYLKLKKLYKEGNWNYVPHNAGNHGTSD